ncbi:YfhO family protein [Cryptosporangium aurantiacum]|uniref:Membrane protein YfhO n=1 Tax=Cryptosporangium aurantiacum TaxID=134849 RepID=A0A1M7RPF8_9ACTN|nr:YfhO family protein [Cryptosporangium aurantiacum]SHN48051.1 membrane protein YfhO [Cryptosporangium aurantiacum]
MSQRSDTVVATPAPEPSEESEQSRPAEPRWQRVLTAVVTLTIIGYALIGIGPALLGQKVFAATDMIANKAPYVNSGLADVQPTNTYLNDTVDSVVPNTTLFGELFRDGDVALWNPYQAGGSAFGSTPNNAVYNPLTVPYLVLPGWLAPGYVKLLEILVAAGATFLFLRRFGLGRAAAGLGGLVFVGSGFMIAWTNWPQTRVAAFIPAVFWCAERLVTNRRARDGALLCLAVASMLLGGFPAVTGYTILFAGLYLVTRVFAEYGGQWRRIVGVVGGAGAALGGAVALAAFQLLPFASAMTGVFIRGREQTPDDHLSPVTALTAVAPWAFGTTDPNRGPYWYLPVNLVESTMYLGAAAVLLILVAVAWPRAAWGRLPRGGWTFFVVAAGLGLLVSYAGGLPLAVLQKLPVLFSDNYVGRMRSVLCFVLAVLAAVGFDLLVRKVAPARAASWVWRVWPALVFSGAAVAGAGLIWRGRRAAEIAKGGENGAYRVSWFDDQVLWAGLFVALAVAAIGVLWWTIRRGRGRWLAGAAAVLVPVLVVVQALTFAGPYWPKSDRDTFYPETGVHTWLAEHLGDDRYAAGGAMFVGSDSYYRLRALNGHQFVGKRFGEALDGMPGWGLGDPPTYVNFRSTSQMAQQPLFDRLGIKYFVTAPWDEVFGTVTEPKPTTGPTTIGNDQPLTERVPGSGPLRAVSVVTAAAFRPDRDAHVRVSLRDSAGKELARGEREVLVSGGRDGLAAGQRLTIPIVAEDLPADAALTAVITQDSAVPLTVEGSLGVVRPADDGLKLVYAGEAVVYERLTALPRIRWANETVVEPDAAARVELVNSRSLAANQVVLDAAGAPATEGSTAEISVVTDGVDRIETRVDASGDGYLVVADALQTDWAVTVDGKAAELVPADHGLVAVAVPKGVHTVALSYRTPYQGAGTYLSAAAAVVLVVIFAGGWWRSRRARHREHEAPVGDVPAVDADH